MSISERVTLRNGAMEAQLAPKIGGSIARLDHVAARARTPLLRAAPDQASHVLDMACFPLVPYCNRIRDGYFLFRGREVRLSPNMKGDPSPLHGTAWLSTWEVAARDEHSAELRYVHEAGEWPWHFEATQHFALDDRGLTVTLTCRNLSAEPMPCGLGQHSYFPCGPETILDTGVQDVWTVDDKVLPVERIAASGRYGLSKRRICGQDLDNGYSGWSGEATLNDPALPFAVRLSSPDARFFQLYSPRDGGFIAAEPVGNANAALNEPEENWGDLGIYIVQRGEAASLTARFAIL